MEGFLSPGQDAEHRQRGWARKMTPLHQQEYTRRKRTQISKIRNEGRDVNDTTEIQKVIQDYYEQLHTNRFDSLATMNTFLETCQLSRMNHEDTENLNRLITSKEIESVIRNLSTNKVQDQAFSLVNSAKHSRNYYRPFSNSSKKEKKRRGKASQLIL